MEWMLVKTFLSLFAVLALMTGIVLVLKKYAYKGHASDSSVVSVEVLGHRMLTPKRSVHVVRVLNKIIVVGVTEGGMTSLSEIGDDESLREVDDRIALQTKSSSPFSTFMDKYMGSFLPNGSKGHGKVARTVLG
jgi:flagellar biogenesis protein FliO